MWLKRAGWALAGMLVLLLLVLLDFMRHGGQFRTLKPHLPGPCTPVPLEASAEDIQIDRARGIAYLSLLDRRAVMQGKAKDGDVLALDLNGESLHAVSALMRSPAGFHPHGLSLYRAGDGSVRLFVVSHPKDQPHTIEIFESSVNEPFKPVATITDPTLRSPNAVAAVGARQFYVANDSGAHNVWQRFAELVLRRGLSEVLYFDGESMRVVARGLKSATGIAVSADGLRIYVSETLGRRVRVYTRNAGTGELSFAEDIELESAPDNLNFDSDGNLWIAAHPKTFELVRHFIAADHPSPTQIFRWSPNAVGVPHLEEIMLDDGRALSAGSVGAVLGKRLFVGSITEQKLLACRLP